jgi:chemotaxis protein MotB
MSPASAPTSTPATHEAQQLSALQQEREQLLATLGDFHERVRDLESKLADRESKSITKSYDELLAIKEVELSELRKTSAESGTLAAQRDLAVGELAQARHRLSQLEQQAAGKDKELASLRGIAAAAADLDVTKRRAAELEAQLAQRDSENRTLGIAAAERDTLAAQLQTAAVALNHTKQRLAGIEKQLAQKDQDLRAQATEKQRLVAESASYAADLKLARQHVAALEQRAVEREQQLQILKRTGSDRDQLASHLSAVNIHLAQAKQQASQLERQLVAKTQETAMLRAVITEKDNLISEITSRKPSAAQPPATREPKPGNYMAGPEQRKGIASSSARSSQQPAPSKPGDPHRARLSQTRDELMRAFQADMARGSMTITQDGNQLSLSLSSSLLFPPGDAVLKPNGIVILKQIGHVLAQSSDRAIQVTGHTDNQAISKEIRKTFPDKRALSWARADSARKALISGGTPPDQVRAVGLADKQPLASNTTEAGRQKNRRIEIIVTQFSTPSRTVTPGPGKRGPNMAALSIPGRTDSQ